MKKINLASFATVLIFLMCSCGNDGSQPATSSAPVASAPASGEAIYKKTCITCHQANGEGLPNTYPPLAKSDFIGDKEKTIGQVIKGYSGELVVNGKTYNSSMPAQQLTDDEIASVLTYVNTSFGNNGGAITADEVKGVRAKL